MSVHQRGSLSLIYVQFALPLSRPRPLLGTLTLLFHLESSIQFNFSRPPPPLQYLIHRNGLLSLLICPSAIRNARQEVEQSSKERKKRNTITKERERRPVRNRASAIQSIRCDPRVAVFTVRYLITVAGAISRARSTHPVHDPWPVLRYILTCPPTGTVPSPISNLDS